MILSLPLCTLHTLVKIAPHTNEDTKQNLNTNFSVERKL